MKDAVPWLEEKQADSDAPQIRAGTLRCQASRTVQDGVPEVGLEALDLIHGEDDALPLTWAYRGELLSMLGREDEAKEAWSRALESAPGLVLTRQRLAD